MPEVKLGVFIVTPAPGKPGRPRVPLRTPTRCAAAAPSPRPPHTYATMSSLNLRDIPAPCSCKAILYLDNAINEYSCILLSNIRGAAGANGRWTKLRTTRTSAKMLQSRSTKYCAVCGVFQAGKLLAELNKGEFTRHDHKKSKAPSAVSSFRTSGC